MLWIDLSAQWDGPFTINHFCMVLEAQLTGLSKLLYSYLSWDGDGLVTMLKNETIVPTRNRGKSMCSTIININVQILSILLSRKNVQCTYVEYELFFTHGPWFHLYFRIVESSTRCLKTNYMYNLTSNRDNQYFEIKQILCFILSIKISLGKMLNLDWKMSVISLEYWSFCDQIGVELGTRSCTFYNIWQK